MTHPSSPALPAAVTRVPPDAAEAVDRARPRPGMSLPGDRFRLISLIGEGGNGTVWKAWDRDMTTSVAIKILRSTDPDRQRRFGQEREVLANLRHSNVVRAFARGVTEDGQPYMALELCAGQSLRARLDAHGPVPWREAVELGIQVAAGLDALHGRGVIHRDVKPGNIMLTTDDAKRMVVKLIDLGAAHLGDDWDIMEAGFTPPPPRHRTQVGVAIGTPDYMPLEAGLGPPDARFDVYGLAVTLYELCTGKLPKLSPSWAPLREIEPSCDAPADLAVVLGAALAIEPEDRTRTAEEFGRALAAVRAAHPEHNTSPLLDGRYERLAVMGTGAKGDVFLATHRGSSHDVALKFLRSMDSDDGHRFRREANLLALFEHPCIPRFYDYAPSGDPPYIVMARAPGVPAAKFCLQRDADRLTPIEVAQVGWQVAEVLAYIHQCGVLHRDINANNVLVDLPATPRINSNDRAKVQRTPRVTLLDFGNADLTEAFYSIAAYRYLTPPESRRVIPDGGIHTLAWAAPETRAGQGFTAKSDVYSLGVLLFRLLTGKMPTSKQGEPVSPCVYVPRCPNDVAFAVLRALHPDPEERPSAAQLATYFEDALAEDEVLAEEAAAEAEAARDRPAAPPALSLVVPLRPPTSALTGPKEWTHFFEAPEEVSHPVEPELPGSSAIEEEGGSARVLMLHPNATVERASTGLASTHATRPDLSSPGAAVPLARFRRASLIAAALGAPAVAALLAFSGALRPSEAERPSTEAVTPTIARSSLPSPPAPASTPAPAPALDRVADQAQQDVKVPAGGPSEGLALATDALTACARKAGGVIFVELETSPGVPRFTAIDVVCDHNTGATCARDLLEQIHFDPPESKGTLVKEYRP